MFYYNMKPIFVLDSSQMTELKFDALAKRCPTTDANRPNFNHLIDEVKTLTLTLFCSSRRFSVFTTADFSRFADHSRRWRSGKTLRPAQPNERRRRGDHQRQRLSRLRCENGSSQLRHRHEGKALGVKETSLEIEFCSRSPSTVTIATNSS